MRKNIFINLFVWLVLVVFALPAFATNYDYYAAVYKRDATKRDNDLTRVSSAVTFKVLTASSDTAATITRFGDPASTSVTNPVSTTDFANAANCNGYVRFRTTASTVDIIVVDTTGGYTAVIKGFSPNDHSIIIDETPNVMHHGIMWFEFGNSNAAIYDTGVNFVPDTVVHDVIVEVTNADSTETINVGTADTEAGFRTLVSVATNGYVKDTGIYTNGTTDYMAATTYGSLLCNALAGENSVNAANVGGLTCNNKHYVITTGTDDDLIYSLSSGSDTAYGYIHYWFTRLR